MPTSLAMPDLTCVMLTCNRRTSLLRSLAELHANADVMRHARDTIVVDNASMDGTAEAVGSDFPDVHVIARDVNDGCAGRNVGAAAACSRYVMFLDDDSWPVGDTASRCVAYLDDHPDVAVVGGRVDLPDGSQDGAALPVVLPACAMCVRVDAFTAVGGFDRAFMRQAEEYDFIFKLISAGWDVARFEDLRWRHEKVAQSRDPAMIRLLDLRNNLVLAGRYLPPRWRAVYRCDWLQRYVALAQQVSDAAAVAEAISDARAMIHADRDAAQSMHVRHLCDNAIERIFGFDHQARMVAHWAAQHSVTNVLIADLSKNVYATYRACRRAGLRIRAVVDDTPAFSEQTYRGVPIMPSRDAPDCDGVVLSTINPATIAARVESWRHRFDRPVLSLWRGRTLNTNTERLRARMPA